MASIYLIWFSLGKSYHVPRPLTMCPLFHIKTPVTRICWRRPSVYIESYCLQHSGNEHSKTQPSMHSIQDESKVSRLKSEIETASNLQRSLYHNVGPTVARRYNHKPILSLRNPIFHRGGDSLPFRMCCVALRYWNYNGTTSSHRSLWKRV